MLWIQLLLYLEFDRLLLTKNGKTLRADRMRCGT